jgi:hypothetical protein
MTKPWIQFHHYEIAFERWPELRSSTELACMTLVTRTSRMPNRAYEMINNGDEVNLDIKGPEDLR